jgi:hypothetical protein
MIMIYRRAFYVLLSPHSITYLHSLWDGVCSNTGVIVQSRGRNVLIDFIVLISAHYWNVQRIHSDY